MYIYIYTILNKRRSLFLFFLCGVPKFSAGPLFSSFAEDAEAQTRQLEEQLLAARRAKARWEVGGPGRVARLACRGGYG